MGKSIIIGLIAGIILGIAQKFIFAGSWDLLIFPGLLGALIGFVSTKVNNWGILGVGAIVGAIVFAISAGMSGYRIMDHTITGAITGLIISLIAKFVVPKKIVS